MSVTFTDQTHELVARQIAEAYETRQRARRSFYRPTQWEHLPQDCQQEHADIAAAALQGTAYSGRELPQWIQGIAAIQKTAIASEGALAAMQHVLDLRRQGRKTVKVEDLIGIYNTQESK